MEAVYARHASLQDFEEFWRDHYDWLKDRGYLLRPRYNPGWVASWIGTNDQSPEDCEDYYIPQVIVEDFNLWLVLTILAVSVQRRRDPHSRREPCPPSTGGSTFCFRRVENWSLTLISRATLRPSEPLRPYLRSPRRSQDRDTEKYHCSNAISSSLG